MQPVYHNSPFLRALIASSFLYAIVGLGGCNKPSSENSAPAVDAQKASISAPDRGILRIAEPFKPPATLNIESDFAFTLMNAGATEPLVNVRMDGTAQPALATQWRRTGDTSWEFDLRPNVKFHDGTDLDADAVVTAFRYIMGVSTPPRSLKGTGLMVEAVDVDTVKFTTSQPDPILPLRLGNANTVILSKGAYASNPANPIGFGTGPYKIDAYDTGSDLKLVAFEDYWGGKPLLDGVEVRFVTDAPARFNALKAGEIHIADAVAPTNILEAGKDSSMHVEGVAMPRSTILMTNMQRGALKSLKIRQAIDLLINKEAIVSSVLEGTALHS